MFSRKFGLILNRNVLCSNLTTKCLQKSFFSTEAAAIRKLLNMIEIFLTFLFHLKIFL